MFAETEVSTCDLLPKIGDVVKDLSNPGLKLAILLLSRISGCELLIRDMSSMCIKIRIFFLFLVDFYKPPKTSHPTPGSNPWSQSFRCFVTQFVNDFLSRYRHYSASNEKSLSQTNYGTGTNRQSHAKRKKLCILPVPTKRIFNS